MKKRDTSYYRLRYYVNGMVDVIELRTADENSVLAGQTMIGFVDAFPSEAEALKAYPGADTSAREFLLPVPF